MEFLCGIFISVYFSVFKFVDCVVVCWSSFVVFLFLFIYLCLSLWTVWWFVGVPLWSVYSLFISLCLSLWTVWWFVGVPLWSFYFCLFLCV